MLKLNSFCQSVKDLTYLNGTSYRAFSVLLILLAFSTSPIFCEERVDLTIQSDILHPKPKIVEFELKRIKEIGGEVLIDGSMRVLEPIYIKVGDLVETTLPVTPAANHVRIYAVASGTFTVIKALFDDGTTKTITNN